MCGDSTITEELWNMAGNSSETKGTIVTKRNSSYCFWVISRISFLGLTAVMRGLAKFWTIEYEQEVSKPFPSIKFQTFPQEPCCSFSSFTSWTDDKGSSGVEGNDNGVHNSHPSSWHPKCWIVS